MRALPRLHPAVRVAKAATAPEELPRFITRGGEEVESLLVEGNAAEVLRAIPDGTFRTTVTSPPYWSLRDYGIPGQVGRRWSGTSTRWWRPSPRCTG